MNRVLRRPMFRMGGSTGTGITSGLDTPKRGIVDGPGKYSQQATDKELIQTSLAKTKEVLPILEELRGKQSPFSASGMPGFLTQFGLNLLATPPRGNIFQTAAVAAQDPFKTLQATQMADRRRRGDQAADTFSNILASEYSLKEAELDAASETGDRDPFKFEKEIEVLEKRITSNNILQAENKRLQEEINSLQGNLNNPNANQAEINSQIQQKQQALNNNNQVISINQTVIDQIKGTDEFKLAEAAYIIETYGADSKEYEEFKKTGKLPRVESADGGRIGYRMGTPEPMMPGVAEAEENQVQDLSYNELRARLPQSIDNDVVQVIANSKQALLDFANIRDQQDVDEFNQRYNVSLNISQEG